MLKRLGLVGGVAIALVLSGCSGGREYTCVDSASRKYFNNQVPEETNATLEQLVELLVEDAQQEDVDAVLASSPAQPKSEYLNELVGDEFRDQFFYTLPDDVELSILYRRGESTTPEGEGPIRNRLWHVVATVNTENGNKYQCGANPEW